MILFFGQNFGAIYRRVSGNGCIESKEDYTVWIYFAFEFDGVYVDF